MYYTKPWVVSFSFFEVELRYYILCVGCNTDNIDNLYQSLLNKKVSIHPAGYLQAKPWGQKEFALLDPDNNLLSFGQSL